jgi:hypothetical protein
VLRPPWHNCDRNNQRHDAAGVRLDLGETPRSAHGPPSACRATNATPARQGSAAGVGSPSAGCAAEVTPPPKAEPTPRAPPKAEPPHSPSRPTEHGSPKSGAATAAEKGKRTAWCDSYRISYDVKPLYDRDLPGVSVGATSRFCVAFAREVAQEPDPPPSCPPARPWSAVARHRRLWWRLLRQPLRLSSSADRSGSRYWTVENKFKFKAFRTDQSVNHHRSFHAVK